MSEKIEQHLGADRNDIFGWIDRISFRYWNMVSETKVHVQIIDSLEGSVNC